MKINVTLENGENFSLSLRQPINLKTLRQACQTKAKRKDLRLQFNNRAEKADLTKILNNKFINEISIQAFVPSAEMLAHQIKAQENYREFRQEICPKRPPGRQQRKRPGSTRRVLVDLASTANNITPPKPSSSQESLCSLPSLATSTPRSEATAKPELEHTAPVTLPKLTSR